jgi:predicted MPP superfamily phosphohydrolase
MPLHAARHELWVRDLDPAHEGLVITHLSDVDESAMTPARRVRRAIELSNAEHPDLVVMTGDYVCRSGRWIPVMGERLRGLEASAGVVTTLGNHDYFCGAEGVAGEMRKNGYDVLRNQHTTLRVRGAPFTIVGVDDAVTKHHDVDRSFRGTRRHGSRLCLTHCPEVGPAAASHGAPLVVAGHTHGGHLHHRRATPWLFEKILGRKYISGWYDLGETRLYVNRGVGASAFSPRLGEGAKAEVAVFVLRRGEPR